MSKAKTGAIAIFVKTPTLSPIKTRLAVAIGERSALEFYLLSKKAVESVVVRAVSNSGLALTPYWAVAEVEGLRDPLWERFETIGQGSANLGERLAHVYATLIERHAYVIFIGADCPLLTPEILNRSVSILTQKDGAEFVMGRAEDGGFYLFGGSKLIPNEVWATVRYSEATTASNLADRLEGQGKIAELPILFDVDTVEDLRRLPEALREQGEWTPEQRGLLSWLQASKFSGHEEL